DGGTGTAASAQAWSASATSTAMGTSRPRPFMSNSCCTAPGHVVATARPYTVSVGRSTTPPARRTATASSTRPPRHERPLAPRRVAADLRRHRARGGGELHDRRRLGGCDLHHDHAARPHPFARAGEDLARRSEAVGP